MIAQDSSEKTAAVIWCDCGDMFNLCDRKGFNFKRSYPSLGDHGKPTTGDGGCVYVKIASIDATIYIRDDLDTKWVGILPAGEIPASVKEKYETNPDPNAFTDDEKIIAGAMGV
jgi:hypothetical protein